MGLGGLDQGGRLGVRSLYVSGIEYIRYKVSQSVLDVFSW